jgi:uncharacterized membrane protein YhaH (DUF805 family)
MKFIEKYQKYFLLDGVASRSEYWGVYILSCVLLIIVLFIAGLFSIIGLPFIWFLGWFFNIIVVFGALILSLWAFVATAVRRCRDAGINVWFSATIFIPPPIGIIPWIIIGCLPTEKKEENGISESNG